jgi:primosomal protein N' (replication factor Y)
MIARVAPLIRLPRSLGWFDYRLEPNQRVTRGSLVAVRFRTRLTPGVVVSIVDHTDIPAHRLRSIERVISTTPYLPDPFLQVAERVAGENFTSIATTLRSILPTFTRTMPKLPPAPAAIVDQAIRQYLDQASGSDVETVLITYRRDETKYGWYQELITRVRAAGRSTLIVAPTVQRVERLLNLFPGAIAIHHQLTPRLYRQNFLAIRQQVPAVVVGTRSAVLAPVLNLGLIVIDDEDADEHVQTEPNPHYDSRRVALMLARPTRAKVILTSRLPSLVSHTNLSQGRVLDHVANDHASIINLEQQRAAGDFAVLTEPVIARLKSVLGRRAGRVLVVHHRRVAFGSLECHECGLIPSCPTCHVPFRQVLTQLACTHCGVYQPIPVRCPRCGSVELRGRGRGLGHVLRELRQARLAARELKPGETSFPTGVIGVTTPAQARQLELDYATVVVTRFDSLLAVPRIDADEQARRLLITLSSRCRQPADLIVQTSPAYRRMIERPLDPTWYRAALATRERFGYPPAWKLLVLRQRTAHRPGRDSPETFVQQVRQIRPAVWCSDPQPSPGRSRVDRAGTTIMVRTRRTVPASLHRLLANLDDSWTITADPVELR